MAGRLILVRHGQSTFNAENRFTGRLDPKLTERGVAEATEAAQRLRASGLQVDTAFSSRLHRASRSARLMLDAMENATLPLASSALDERDYGELTGLNKAEATARFGAAQVQRWRRAFTEGPPGGESLRDTLARVAPFYLREVLPPLLRGHVVLIVSHGNTLRALVTLLEDLAPEDAEALEIATGELLVFAVDGYARATREAVLHTASGSLTAPAS